MRNPAVGVTAELARHFFRRLFENDVFQSDGDTSTTVVRVLATMAALPLMFGFFLQNSYPQRSAWGRVEDHYFFVLFSFVVMAGVALFEWEMFFPERLDFLILTPLPLQPGQLLRAKAAALGCLMGAFLLAANLFGVLILPAVSRGPFWRQVWAQAVAVSLAGAFAMLAVMAVGGLLLCVLPAPVFSRVSPLVQMLTTTVLVLLLVQYARFGDGLQTVLERPGRAAHSLPTFWFLGVYEHLLHGNAAASFAAQASRQAWVATGVTAGLAVGLYPLAWRRMQRTAVQGEAVRGRGLARWKALQSWTVRTPAERAVFSFIGKTLVRNGRYQVYLAIYGGVGAALAISCGVTLLSQGGSVRMVSSLFGLHAVLPLLLFWTVSGLGVTFAFPQNLPARWIFRLAPAGASGCAEATRQWVLRCGLAVVLVAVLSLAALGWGGRALLVQFVMGVCFCEVLVDSFFVAQRGAPFTRPRSPNKTNLPAVLTLYAGVLPPALFGMAWLGMRMERHPVELVWPCILTILTRISLVAVRTHLLWTGEEGEGADGEFQLLGLAGELRS